MTGDYRTGARILAALAVEADELRPEISAGHTAGYHIAAADPSRWVDIGSDHLQQGLMALRRALKPEGRF